jgi:glycosyltransferase involved in cell wall biosynthesis
MLERLTPVAYAPGSPERRFKNDAMRRILFVLPSLEYTGAGKQTALLVGGLPRDRYESRICAWGGDGPLGKRLREAGAMVDVLGRSHFFNLAAVGRWRRLLRAFQPDVIHTWGPGPLRLAALCPGRSGSRLIASAPLPVGERSSEPGRLDRWLLRRADLLAARGLTEVEHFFRLGVPAVNVVTVPPGVEQDAGTPAFPDRPGIPSSSRLITCVGSLRPHKGFRNAIWALDILRILFNDLRLLLIGTGPDRQRLERFVRAVELGTHVQFLGSRDDVPALLSQSELVWVPSLAASGLNVALEAMAQGRPVVTSRLGDLAEIVHDGETGFLVAPGNKLELARRTRLLLDDAGLRRRLGEAGRRRVSNSFAAAAMVRRFDALYDAGWAQDRTPTRVAPNGSFKPLSPVLEGEGLG